MKIGKPILLLLFLLEGFLTFAQEDGSVIVIPKTYDNALRNPMKGFTTTNVSSHPWGTLTHSYIRWNEIENKESDGIEKIINYCNQKWKDAAEKNMKVIPRVYLHWDGDQKYWPADLQTDDYTSEEFQERVLRLIQRLGMCWDNDPRVAFVELGIFGKWGEHHSPSPALTMQELVGDAFAEAFKNKKVSVRHNWQEFMQQPFGEYWDSWAHYDQMYPHGNSIKQVNQAGRYKVNYIGGEVAYNWGNWDIQPGTTPTESVADENHRNFVINSIRWLHCTQLKWISNYDKTNSEALLGAIEIQKAFGYRYELNQAEFSLSDSLNVAFDVTNSGSAPFYYNWPVEVALLNPETHEPVWRSTFDSVDIRKWLPGEGWTDPEWTPSGNWSQYLPNVNWNSSEISEWTIPPSENRVEGQFKIDLPDGSYILSLAILDPAGNTPGIRFATANYLNGGRHPLGLVSVGEDTCYTLPGDFSFDDPHSDQSLYYDDDFEIDIVPDPLQTPFEGAPWQFPVDTVSAWQYDFMYYPPGDKLFSLDTSNTIGLYGCGVISGQDMRYYQDSVPHEDAAQFMWDQTAETFQKNGQWLKYSAVFKINQPYQLLLKARSGTNANFRLKIYSTLGDTVFKKDISITDEFDNLGGGNEHTNWLISKFATPELWGNHILRFDWYDNIGEPGIFGSFSFLGSTFDVTPPEWNYVSIGVFTIGTDIQAACTEEGKIYLVPAGTLSDTVSIYAAAVAELNVTPYTITNLPTGDLTQGVYVLYAIDESGNISEASREITLESDITQVNVSSSGKEDKISIRYNTAVSMMEVTCDLGPMKVMVYDILGNLQMAAEFKGTHFSYNFSSSQAGVHLVRVWDKSGESKIERIVIQ